MRFSPGQRSQVLTARLYLLEVRPIDLYVWDASQKQILKTRLTASQVGWNDFDLSAQNIVMDGDFYVGFVRWEYSMPALGVDTNSPLDSRSYFIDHDEWTS